MDYSQPKIWPYLELGKILPMLAFWIVTTDPVSVVQTSTNRKLSMSGMYKSFKKLTTVRKEAGEAVMAQ